MSHTITDKYLRKIIRTLKNSAAKHRNDIRPGRRRFGIYKYLTDVYQVYRDLRLERSARRATRRIAKISRLSLKKKSHPIRILIEASAGLEDARQKSRWTQALKYAFGWRLPAAKLKWCFENSGGISGCAAKYAAKNKNALRKSGGGENNIIHRQGDLGDLFGATPTRQDGSNRLAVGRFDKSQSAAPCLLR